MLIYDPLTANERAYLEGNGMLERTLPLQQGPANPGPAVAAAPVPMQYGRSPAPIVVRAAQPPYVPPPPAAAAPALVQRIAPALGMTTDLLIQRAIRAVIAVAITIVVLAGMGRALAETPVAFEGPVPADAVPTVDSKETPPGTKDHGSGAGSTIADVAKAIASKPQKTADKTKPATRRALESSSPGSAKSQVTRADSEAAPPLRSDATEIAERPYSTQFHFGQPAAADTPAPRADGVAHARNGVKAMDGAPALEHIDAADHDGMLSGGFARTVDTVGKPGVVVAIIAMLLLLFQTLKTRKFAAGSTSGLRGMSASDTDMAIPATTASPSVVTPKPTVKAVHATPATMVAAPAPVLPALVACFPPVLLSGSASHQGHVRSRMEDRVRLVHAVDVVAAVVCDGVGGMPLGADAAEAATQAASEYLYKHARADIRCVEAAFAAAARGVQKAASAKGVCDGEGHRTTLLVAIASESTVAWGYAGDGAIVLVRGDDGAVCELLVEQHDASGALTASLGPAGLWGRPRFGMNAFEPGDAVVLGTDGCILRCPSRAQFIAWLLAMAQNQRTGTNLSAGLASALAEFVAVKDANNFYIADDNATCAVLMRDRVATLSSATRTSQRTAPLGVA